MWTGLDSRRLPLAGLVTFFPLLPLVRGIDAQLSPKTGLPPLLEGEPGRKDSLSLESYRGSGRAFVRVACFFFFLAPHLIFHLLFGAKGLKQSV